MGGTKRREDSRYILACSSSRTLLAGCGLPQVAAAADAIRPFFTITVAAPNLSGAQKQRTIGKLAAV